MANENRCPFCGGELRTCCEYGRFNKKWNVTVACDTGHSVNFHLDLSDNTPIPEVSEAAKAAFSHPAHLTRGMVILDRQTAVDALEMLENPPSGETFGYHDNFRLPVVKSLTAAIEAAKTGEEA